MATYLCTWVRASAWVRTSVHVLYLCTWKRTFLHGNVPLYVGTCLSAWVRTSVHVSYLCVWVQTSMHGYVHGYMRLYKGKFPKSSPSHPTYVSYLTSFNRTRSAQDGYSTPPPCHPPTILFSMKWLVTVTWRVTWILQ